MMKSLPDSLTDGTYFKCLILEEKCDGKCCRGGGSIFIYADDIFRFMQCFNLCLEDFLDRYTKIEKIYCGSTDHKPLIPVVTIKEKAEGACIFLSDEGKCSVYQDSPIQCKLYPFWDMYCSSDGAWERVGKNCPGVDKTLVHGQEHFYPPEKILELVNKDKKSEEDWERAMIDWDDDYKGYLEDFIQKKKLVLKNTSTCLR